MQKNRQFFKKQMILETMQQFNIYIGIQKRRDNDTNNRIVIEIVIIQKEGKYKMSVEINKNVRNNKFFTNQRNI